MHVHPFQATAPMLGGEFESRPQQPEISTGHPANHNNARKGWRME